MPKIHFPNDAPYMRTSLDAETLIDSKYGITTRAIHLAGFKFKRIPSLAKYTNLEYLDISSNDLTEIPELPPSITMLSCGNNNLTSLPELPAGLLFLNINNNNFTVVPNLPPNIKELIISCNELRVIENLPNTLKKLCVSSNNIEHMDNLPTELIELSCTCNSMLTISQLPPTLKKLDAALNSLTVLPELPPLLQELIVAHNELIEIPSLPLTLKKLQCHNNYQLTYLPPLPESLVELDCNECDLIRIPVLPESISYVNISYNPILFIEHIPKSIEFYLDWSYYNIHDDEFNIDNEKLICFDETPIYDFIFDFPDNRMDYIETCRHRLQVFNRFRELFYHLKFKQRFRDWLWKKVRLPKIERMNHPDRLRDALESADPEDDLVNVVETFATINNSL